MASLIRRPNGHHWVQFLDESKRRQTIRLGATPKRVAEAIKSRIEYLIAAQRSGVALDADTATWLGSIEDALYDKLAATGLVTKREPEPAEEATPTTLAAFLKAYIKERTDITPRTANNLEQAAGFLVRFFKADCDLATIAPGDADDFRRWLSRRLGENTVRRHCGRSRQFFRYAQRKRLIAENPFAGMKDCAVRANRSRDQFIDRDTAAKVLEACPNTDWRLIFGLSRFGGLRCPSEVAGLTWADVDFVRQRIRVRSPKTQIHEGKDQRLIPLFPELRADLEEARKVAERGAVQVFSRPIGTTDNLSTHLRRIIRRAGLKPWPKLFANLRASRATELAATFPPHTVAAWMGHSVAVSREHYLRVTDAEFDAALTGGEIKTKHLPKHSDVVLGTLGTLPEISPSSKTSENAAKTQKTAKIAKRLRCERVPPAGFEPTLPG